MVEKSHSFTGYMLFFNCLIGRLFFVVRLSTHKVVPFVFRIKLTIRCRSCNGFVVFNEKVVGLNKDRLWFILLSKYVGVFNLLKTR